jgi:hypothetical protein
MLVSLHACECLNLFGWISDSSFLNEVLAKEAIEEWVEW